jgi:hypothetical protein
MTDPVASSMPGPTAVVTERRLQRFYFYMITISTTEGPAIEIAFQMNGIGQVDLFIARRVPA